MRSFFTTAEAVETDVTQGALRADVRRKKSVRVARGVYAEGGAPATVVEQSVAGAVVTGGAVGGQPAGVLLGLDSMRPTKAYFTVPTSASNKRTGARRRDLKPDQIVLVDDIRVTSGTQTLIDLAAELDDLVWKQALESALFRKHATVSAIEAALPEMSRARTSGVSRIRRVLALRPPGAPPTESLLETLMVQLARAFDAPTPTRQYVLYDEWDQFVARIDLCWPELGVFVELDGQGHIGQPVYDASRQTNVAATTGWLVGRYTWNEVRLNPKPTGRRLLRLLEQGRRRPVTDFRAPDAS